LLVVKIMRTDTVTFLLGILFCQTFSVLPNGGWIILFSFLLFFLWRLSRWFRFFTIFTLGVAWAVWHAEGILSQKLPVALENHDVKISGFIIGIPQQGSSEPGACSWRFDLAPQTVVGWENAGTVRLSWYEGPSEPLRPGQRWQFTVRLKRVHGVLNPGVTDYERQLFRQGIVAIGYVRDSSYTRKLNESNAFNIDYWRYHLTTAIERVLGDSSATGSILALTLGNSQKIEAQQWEVWRKTGTVHLLSVSGLHVVFIAWLVFGLMRIISGAVGQVALRFSALRLAAGVSFFAALIYALLAGFSVPTQRALVMLAVPLTCILLARHVAFSRGLALALLLVLLYDPLAVMDIGFWLSFWAVAVMAYVTLNKRQIMTSALMRQGVGFGRAQWAVMVGLLPLSLFFFSYNSITSLPANAIAIPWLSFAVLPAALLGTAMVLPLPEIGGWLLQFAAYIMDLTMISIQYLATVEWSVWQHTFPPLWSVVVATVGVLILLAPLPHSFLPKWLLGIIWLLPLFFLTLPKPRLGEIWFTLLDVDQGLAAVIRTANHVLIYDTGMKFCRSDRGETVIVPFLRSQGIQQIDKIVLSHEDMDHRGGLESILRMMPVEQVMTNFPYQFKDKQAVRCQTGEWWQWDNVKFQLFHSTSSYTASKRNCVLKVSATEGSILLPGDIEKSEEYYLANNYSQEIQANILIAAHHGSATSSTTKFITTVNPQIVLFSTGYLNRFGHPKKEVVERYQQYGVQWWNTAAEGAISFQLTAAGISTPWLARREMRRYWHLPKLEEKR
jgi:competence protein ComEC